MAKRLNNETPINEILQHIIQNNNLQTGIDQVNVKQAWKKLMGNGVNSYTKNMLFKNGILHVELSSAVLREELNLGKSKIIKLLNEELKKDVVKNLKLR